MLRYLVAMGSATAIFIYITRSSILDWKKSQNLPSNFYNIKRRVQIALESNDTIDSCLQILENTGLKIGRSWGQANSSQKEFWHTWKCDDSVKRQRKTTCPVMLASHNASGPSFLPLAQLKLWDQLDCNRVNKRTQQNKSGKKLNLLREIQNNAFSFWNPPAITNQAQKNRNSNEKPTRFPRDVALFEPLPSWPQSGKRKEVTILLWNSCKGHLLWGEQTYAEEVRTKCSTSCQITSDKTQLPNADAVIFHAKTHRGDFPRALSPKTKLILASLETPGYAMKMRNTQYMKRFDFFTTYSLESFVPLTYVEREWNVHEFYLPPPLFSEKKGFAAVFISNCKAAGAKTRTQYLQKLMKLIQVDSFGGCLNNAEEEKVLGEPGKQMTRKEKKFALMQRYKFYLAFENSPVIDYTSEKVFEGLRAGVLPVYHGSSTVKTLLPHPNSVVVASGMTPEALATHLKVIASNETLYNSFFDWKKRPVENNFIRVMEHSAHNWTSMCHICHKLSELHSLNR